MSAELERVKLRSRSQHFGPMIDSGFEITEQTDIQSGQSPDTVPRPLTSNE